MPLKTPFDRPGTLAVIAALALVLAALILTMQRRGRADALLRADPDEVLSHPALARTALDIGGPAFARRCAGCHGSDGAGDRLKGAPDLRTGEHLYGSASPEDFEQIVLYGIRAGNSRGKTLASMPAFARAKPYAGEPIAPLVPAEITDVTEFVLSLSGRASDRDAAIRGKAIYDGKGGCYDCHGGDGRGDPGIGAPNLGDSIWLYGDGSARSIAESIAYGRAGICPAFSSRITPLEARAIAIYVASLSHVDPAMLHVDPAKSHVDPAKSHVDPAKSRVDPAKSHVDPAKTLL
jgi:cbb3-type cytochrome c oxidase subunit III